MHAPDSWPHVQVFIQMVLLTAFTSNLPTFDEAPDHDCSLWVLSCMSCIYMCMNIHECMVAKLASKHIISVFCLPTWYHMTPMHGTGLGSRTHWHRLPGSGLHRIFCRRWPGVEGCQGKECECSQHRYRVHWEHGGGPESYGYKLR